MSNYLQLKLHVRNICLSKYERKCISILQFFKQNQIIAKTDTCLFSNMWGKCNFELFCLLKG